MPPRRSVYDYVRAIYILGGRPGGSYVPLHVLAGRLGVSRATVAVMAKRLQARGLAERAPRAGLRLTDAGLEALARFAWKVGLAELVLSGAGLAGVSLARLARRLACEMSDEEAEELCERMGHPRRCPHGHFIPHPCRGEYIIEGTCVLLLH